LNPLAPQDYVPLGITCGASGFLEFITTLVHPVPLHVIMFSEQHLTATNLVKCRNLLPCLRHVGQHLLHHQDKHVDLVIGLALQPGHGNHDNQLIANLPYEKIMRRLESGRRHQFLYAFIDCINAYKKYHPGTSQDDIFIQAKNIDKFMLV
jgi:hypothetical protein